MLEAGLPTQILAAEVPAMAAPNPVDVLIAGGDTKVVEHVKADQMYINTAGISHLADGSAPQR